MRRFTGKVAFITGAASGIGRATASRSRAEGARVAIIDRTEDALRQTAERSRRRAARCWRSPATCRYRRKSRLRCAQRRDVRPHRLRLQQRRRREQGDAASRDRARRVGPHPRHQSAGHVRVHEARDRADAAAGRRRGGQHLVRRRHPRRRRRQRLCRFQARHHRHDQIRRARLCEVRTSA